MRTTLCAPVNSASNQQSLKSTILAQQNVCVGPGGCILEMCWTMILKLEVTKIIVRFPNCIVYKLEEVGEPDNSKYLPVAYHESPSWLYAWVPLLDNLKHEPAGLAKHHRLPTSGCRHSSHHCPGAYEGYILFACFTSKNVKAHAST